MKSDKIFMWTAIVILVIAVIVLAILLMRKKNGKNDDKNGKCPSDKAQVGWGKKFQASGKPAVLDMAKLQSVVVGEGNHEYKIIDGPVWFPDGVSIYKDVVFSHPDLSNSAIDKALEQSMTSDKNTIDLNSQDVQKLLNMKVSDIDGLDPADQEAIKEKIAHYLQMIDQFLHDNPDAAQEWEDTKNYLKYLLLGHNADGSTTPPKKPGVPKMGSIYTWIKYILSKLGGIGNLLKMFERRIKYDLIMDVANSHRDVDASGPITPSHHCTAYPLSWWQNCPDGTKPVGHQGWGKDKNKYACTHWYQHLSGELMCQKYIQNFQKPVGGTCTKLIDVLGKADKFVKNPDVHKFISESLAAAMAAASLIPHIGPVIAIVAKVIKLALPLMGDFSWIMADIEDVCYNFVCAGNTKDKVCVGQPGCDSGNCYCKPKVADSVLASRVCPAPDCNKAPNGVCTTQAAAALRPMRARMADPTINNAPGYQFWS